MRPLKGLEHGLSRYGLDAVVPDLAPQSFGMQVPGVVGSCAFFRASFNFAIHDDTYSRFCCVISLPSVRCGFAEVHQGNLDGIRECLLLHQGKMHGPAFAGQGQPLWDGSGPAPGHAGMCPDLTLALLNDETQAEHEYNREVHSEIGEAPIA
jgi:hypothetical protein